MEHINREIQARFISHEALVTLLVHVDTRTGFSNRSLPSYSSIMSRCYMTNR